MELDSIAEAYVGMYQELTEELHKNLQSILDDENIQPRNKLSSVSREAKRLLNAGEDTGLEDSKPKKGSSRAVFFPKEPKKITVDGQETSAPTAVKVAFSGELDKHHGEDTTLGEDQNRKEGDYYLNKSYGILNHDSDTGHYKSSNLDSGGVLAPVFETHQADHHLEMGRVSKYNAKDVAEATKTPDFPKGLTHKEIKTCMEKEHADANGGRSYNMGFSDEHLEKVRQHPWVSDAIDMMHDSGMHPGDLDARNMGIYTHPITGKKHVAIIDWGYDNDIAKKYATARKNKFKRAW